MDIFFRGAITSSPIKTRNTQGRQLPYSFDTSFLSDASFECFSTNPETGFVHVCRRSPRLLANGYYVLSEDNVVKDDQGNLTLTATETNISYKENLARIFRRRRKARRSFATLLTDVGQSLLSGSIFGQDNNQPSTKLSSCLDVSSDNEQDTSVCFKYDPTEILPLKDKERFLPQVESLFQDCSAPDLPSSTQNSLIDVPQQSKCYCTLTKPPPSDAVFRKCILVFLLTVCLCANIFSRFVCGGIAVAMAFLFMMISSCHRKSRTTYTRLTKTEDITSRNE